MSLVAGLMMLLLSGRTVAQSKYNNQIQPGLHTRADVDRALGPPQAVLGNDSFEYQPPTGASRLVVEYQPLSGVVSRIEATFATPYARTAMLQALKIPTSTVGKVFVRDGKLMEAFADPTFVGFVCEFIDGSNKVASLVYYSRELFSSSFDAFRNMPELLNQPILGGAAQPPVHAPVTPRSVAPGVTPIAKPYATITPGIAPSSQDRPAPGASTTSELGTSPPTVHPGLPAPSLGPPADPSSRLSGVINWSGRLEKDQLITVDGLPGVPVMVDLNTTDFSVVEPPSPANGWQRLVIRNKKRKGSSVVSVKWTAIQ